MRNLFIFIFGAFTLSACTATDLQAFANALNSIGDDMQESAVQVNQNTQQTQSVPVAIQSYKKPISKVCYRGSNYITCN